MEIKSSSGQVITSLNDWFRHSPPAAGERHWKEGRSAKELAKYWMKNGELIVVPNELQSLFNSNPVTSELLVESVIPECTTKLDNFGKGRMHDLLLIGKKDECSIVISIEAKADETFGPTIAERHRNNSVNSKIDERINLLSKQLFLDVNIESLRYQLLHGIAGTLLEAKKQKADFAVFVVQEFTTSLTDPKKQQKNSADLNLFISTLVNEPVNLKEGSLLGPIRVPVGNVEANEPSLFFGKIRTEVK